MLKRTSLHPFHQQKNARLFSFGEWEMPLHYTSISEEHLAVRKASGLFDISHMGEIFIKGEDAFRFTNWALTNDLASLESGKGQYSILCNDDGGVIDDLYVFRIDGENFLMVINSSRTESVLKWFEKLRARSDFQDLRIEDASQKMSAFAIQGPRVSEFIDACFSGESGFGRLVKQASALKKNEIGGFDEGNEKVWISRTGYTGEDGFEVFSSNSHIVTLWHKVLFEGKRMGLCPIGLGARNTLRIEMGYPLYGCEMNEDITALEAGLGAFVKLKKGEFVGREALQKQANEGLRRSSLAFKMIGKTPPPRAGYVVNTRGIKIGKISSGAFSPMLQTGIGMALVHAKKDLTNDLSIEIRGRDFPAKKMKKPLYKKDQKD